MTDNGLFKCPECGSSKVAVTAEQMFMVNTGDHYCHSVKTQDANAKATCLECRWVGRRDQLRGKAMTDKKIITQHVKPPIPTDIYDWCATFDGYEPGDVMGWGSREDLAIRDLKHNARCGKTCQCVTNCGDDGGDHD